MHIIALEYAAIEYRAYLSITVGFLHVEATCTPLHSNHHLSAATVCTSSGSLSDAPGISASVNTMFAVSLMFQRGC